jgi:hypothetical protein
VLVKSSSGHGDRSARTRCARTASGGTIGIYATAGTKASGAASSSMIAVGFSRAASTATIDIQQGAQITAGKAAVVTATATAEAKISATTERAVDSTPNPGKAQVAVSLAVALADISSTVTVAKDALVQGGKTANVSAKGSVESSAEAKSGIFSSGLAGLAFAIEVSDADIHTIVDGTVKALAQEGYTVKIEIDPLTKITDYRSDEKADGLKNGQTVELVKDQGALKLGTYYKYLGTDLTGEVVLVDQPYGNTNLWQPVTPDPVAGYVDVARDRIYVGANALVTEDTITYTNRRGTSIVGLVDGWEYYVIDVGDGWIKLAETSGQALQAGLGEQYHPGNVAPLGYDNAINVGLPPTENNTLSFAISNLKDGADTITLRPTAGAVFNTFELGQAVTYKAPKNGTALAGLVDGGTYYIVAPTSQNNLQGDSRFLDEQVIQLAESENEARAGVFIKIGPPPAGSPAGDGTHTLTARHVLDSGFATGVGIVSELKAENKASAEAGLKSADDPDEKKTLWGKAKEKWDTNIGDKILEAATADYTKQIGNTKTGAQAKLNVAGALALVFADHDVTTDVTSNARLKSNEDLEVKATISQKLELAASSSTEPQEEIKNKDGTKKLDAAGNAVVKPGAENSVSVALGVAIVDNDAKATIHGQAELDALRATRVIADISYPFTQRLDTYVPLSWGELTDAVRTDGVEAITKYLNTNLGAKDSFFNTWNTATSSAEKVSIAGAVTVMVLNNDAQAVVKSGAKINQDTDGKWFDDDENPHPNQAVNRADTNDGDGLGEQVVSIEATNYQQMINMTGNFSLPELSLDLDTIDPSSWKKTKGNFVKFGEQAKDGVWGSSGSAGGAGGALFVGVQDNTTKAIVEDGAAVASGDDGGFNMKAEQAQLNVQMAQSAAKGGDFGIAGSVLYNGQTSHTLAQLGAAALVSGREARLYAGNLDTTVTLAGGVAKGEALGVGISVGINNVDRTTLALIGAESVTAGSALKAGTSIGVEEQVHTKARVSGDVMAFTVAGAVVQEEKKKEEKSEKGKPQSPTDGGVAGPILGALTQEEQAKKDKESNQTGIAVAAAASVNLIKDTTTARIADAGTLTAGSVFVEAENDGGLVAATGGLAVAIGKSGGTSVALAGAFSYNEVTATTTAEIQDTRLELSGNAAPDNTLHVKALTTSSIFALAAGGSGAVAAGQDSSGGTGSGTGNDGSTAVAVAGSVTINTITGGTVALMRHSAALLDDGDVTVEAKDESSIFAIAGGLSLAVATGASGSSGQSTAVSAGVAVAVNKLSTDVSARIEASRPGGIGWKEGGTGALLVQATNTRSIGAYTLAGAVSVASGTQGNGVAGALAASGSVNQIVGDTVAAIRGSTVNVPGAVTVKAKDEAEITAGAGGIAAALGFSSKGNGGAGAFGAAFAINSIGADGDANVVLAEVEQSTVNAGDNVLVDAQSTATIFALAIGAAGSVSGSGSGNALSGSLAGSATVNKIRNKTQARVAQGSSVSTAEDSGGSVTVQARDESSINATSGGVAVSIAMGTNGQSVALGLGFSLTINDIANELSAVVENSDIDADGAVTVEAVSEAEIESLAFGLAVSVALSNGDEAVAANATGALAFNTIDNTVEAAVRNTAAGGTRTLWARGDVSVTAEDESTIVARALAAAVSVSGSAGGVSVALSIGLALAFNTIDREVSAHILNMPSVITDGGDIHVSATDAARIEVTSIAAAVALSVSLSDTSVGIAGGASASTNVILGRTRAFVENSRLGTDDDRVGAVDVEALSTGEIDAIVGAVSLAVSVGNNAVGVGVGIAVARNFIGWDPDGKAVEGAIDAGDTLQAKLTPGMKVRLIDGPLKGEVYEFVGDETDDSNAARDGKQGFDLRQQQYRDPTQWRHVSVDAPLAGSQVQAIVKDSAIRADGGLTVAAEGERSIEAIVVAAAAGVAVGTSGVGVGVSAAGSYAENKIRSDITAQIDGDGLDTDRDGIEAASVTVSATDASGIDAIAGAASLAVGFGTSTGIAVAVGLSLGFNEVNQQVQASIRGADEGVKTADDGAVRITAQAEGRKLFDINLAAAGLSAALLDDAAVADADDPDDPTNEPVLIEDKPDDPETPDINERTRKVDPARRGDDVTKRGDDTVNEAVVDADADRAVLSALRAAFTAAGEELAMFDIVATPATFNTGDGTQDVREGTTVRVEKGYPAAKGLEGRVYRYIVQEPEGSSPANNIDLGDANYTDTSRWQLVDKLKVSKLVDGQSWSVLTPDGKTYVLTLSADGKSLSVSRNTINAISAAASVAVGIGLGGAGVAVAGAGAVSQNVILSSVNAYGRDSFIDSDGDVEVEAASNSGISSAVVALSAAVAGGTAAGVGASIGISVARNFIGSQPDGTEVPVTVAAYLQDTAVDADGALRVEAVSAQSIDAIVFAGSVALAIGGSAGVGIAGSGVWAENRIDVDLSSRILGDDAGGRHGIAADSVTVTADDRNTIRAFAGAVSIAAAGGTVGVSASIGVALARNTIAGSVEAAIVGADGQTPATADAADADSRTDFGITARGGDGVTVRATEEARIRALTAAASVAAGFGVAGGVAVAGAGADAHNVILTDTQARIQGSAVDSAGVVDVNAVNEAKIQAAVLSASVAIAAGAYAGVGASIGVAIARNQIGWSTNDKLASTHTTASSPASVVKNQTVKIESGAGKGNVYRYIGDKTLDRPTTGTADDNARWLTRLNYFDKTQWEQVNLDAASAETRAIVVDSDVIADGDVTVEATAEQEIQALVFAGSVALSGGFVGASLSGAGAASDNRIGAQVEATIRGDLDDRGVSGSGVAVTAADDSSIESFTGAVAIAAGFGAVGVALSVGVGVAVNEIDVDVEAKVEGAPVTSTATDIHISAVSDAEINAKAGAAAAAVSAGGIAGSLSGAGVLSRNVILGSVKAHADDSVLDSAAAVLLEATNDATIESKVLAASAAVGLGGAAGAGLSIGVSIAENRIGRENAPTLVEAYLHRSRVDADEALSITADAEQDIKATIASFSVAASTGAFAGIGLSGAGSVATNTIYAKVTAAIDGTDPLGDKAGPMGVIADSVTVTAADLSIIDAFAGSASVAVGVGAAGLSASVGVSLARNEVVNQVTARISGASGGDQRVTTRGGGDIVVSATEDATITSSGFAASAALGGGLVGVGVAGAGIDVVNVVRSKTNAAIAESVIVTDADGTANAGTGGHVRVTAQDLSTISAQVLSLAGAAGLGVVGGAVAVGIAKVSNFVGFKADGSADAVEVQATIDDSSIDANGQLELSALETATIIANVDAKALALGGGLVAVTGAGAGSSSQNRVKAKVRAAIDDDRPTASTTVTDPAGIRADSILMTAHDESTISATTGAAAIAGAVGLISGSIAVAEAEARNRVENEVEASVNAVAELRARGTGGIDLDATSSATVTSTTTAAGIAVGVGWLGGLAISSAGAEAVNVILTKTLAHIDGSTVHSTGKVELSAVDGSTVNAFVRTSSVAAAGGYVGIAVSIGSATAHNFIGYTEAGAAQPVQVKAYLSNTGVDADGEVSLQATETATINANIQSAGTGVAAGAIAVAAAGAGVTIENKVKADVAAYVESTPSTAVRTVQGDAGVSIGAQDTSIINATANAVSFAVAIGAGGAGAVSLSKATNRIDTVVDAHASRVRIVTTGTGDLSITAKESATITTAATAASAGFAVVVATAGSGAEATSTIATVTKAYADPVELDVADDVSIDAINTGSVTTTSFGTASATGLIAIAAAVTKATSTLTPQVDSSIGGFADSRVAAAGGDITVSSTLAGTSVALAAGGSDAFGLGVSVGETTATATIKPSVAGQKNVTSTVSGGTLRAGQGGITVQTVYNTDRDNKVVNGSGAMANAYAAAGGLIGTSGAKAEASETTALDSWVDSDATLSAGGGIRVTANSQTSPTAVAAGQAGGLVGVGKSTATATASPTVNARMEGNVRAADRVGAASLEVRALSGDKATANSKAVSGGLVANSTNSSAATASPQLDAHVGANAVIDLAGRLEVEANVSPEADAITTGVARGLGALGASVSSVLVAPTVSGYVGSGSDVRAGAVDVKAIVKPVANTGNNNNQDPYRITAASNGNETITVVKHGLSNGDVIEYRSEGSDLINGLVETYPDGQGNDIERQYSVLVIDADTLALGAEAAGVDIDGRTESIRFETPHNLRDGDQVTYKPADPARLIPGLTANAVYTVRVVDTNTIQLKTPNASLSGFTIDRVSADGKLIDAFFHNLQDGQAVTYVAPAARSFYSAQVDISVGSDANGNPTVTNAPFNENIYFLNDEGRGVQHGFNNGERVVYRVAPSTAGGEIVPGTPIGGLRDGQTYVVETIGAFQLQLLPGVTASVTFTKAVGGNTPAPAKITGANWADYGFAAGDRIRISGTGANNDDYVISRIVGTTLEITGDFGLAVTQTKTITGLDPIELAPDKANSAVHSLTRPGDLPIANLVSGHTYYVVKPTNSQFAFGIALAPGGEAIVLQTAGLSPSAGHAFGPQSIDIGATDGSHQFRIDITETQFPTAAQRIVGAGGVGLATLSPPPGDGVSTASSTGSGKGFVGSIANSSLSTSNATVTAYIASGSMVVTGVTGSQTITGNVNLLADSLTNARANTNNAAGGFVGVGTSNAATSQNSSTEAYVAANSSIGATGDVRLDAVSLQKTTGSARAEAGGFAADVRANMSSALTYSTKANLRSGAKIVADGHVGVTSDARIDVSVKSWADGRGFGGGGYADTNVTVTDGSSSRVDIGENAIVIGRTVALRALTTQLSIYAEAKGYGAGFVGVSKNNANIKIGDSDTAAGVQTHVELGSGSRVTGYDGVDMVSRFSGVDTYADTFGQVTGLFGYVEANANNDTTLKSFVVADPRDSASKPRALVTAGPRLLTDPNLAHPTDPTPGLGADGQLARLALYVQATNGINRIGRDADTSKRALAGGGSSGDTDNRQTRRVNWNADVDIFAGQSPELEIDANGVIRKAVNVSVKTSENANQTSGPIQSEDVIVVNDIGNRNPGQVYFNNAGDPTGNGTVQIGGSGSRWTFSDTYRQVLITNLWNKPLQINNIDVVNTTGNPLVDLNGKNVSLTFALDRTVAPSLVKIVNDAPSDIILNGTINNPIGATVIHDTGGSVTAARDRGVAETSTGRESLVRTAILDLRSLQANVGSAQERINVDIVYSANALPTTRFVKGDVAGSANRIYLGSAPLFDGQRVRYETDGAAIGGLTPGAYYTVLRPDNGASIQLASWVNGTLQVVDIDPGSSAATTQHRLVAAQHVVGVAGNDLYLDLKAVLRDATVVTAFTATVDSLTAGGTIDLLLQDSVQETGPGKSAGTRVTTLNETANFNYPATTGQPADGTRDWNFLRFFRPDTTTSLDRDLAAFGGTALGSRDTLYDFRDLDATGSRTLAGLVAGRASGQTAGSIVINDVEGAADGTTNGVAAATAPTIDLIGRSDILGTGNLRINIDGTVTLAETAGDLRVGLIRSRAEDADLTALQGSIEDAANGDGDDPAGDSGPDVVATNVTLLAESGSIGSDANFLEIDSSNRRGAVENGVLDAQALNDIRITETVGNLRLKLVDSDEGNVSLVTLDGSVLDARAGAGLVTDAAVVLANSIDIQAIGGSIGSTDATLGGDVEIDSQREAQGDVGLEASVDIYLTEVDGTLRLVQARTPVDPGTVGGGNIRLTVRESTVADSLNEDLDLLETGSVLFVENAPRTVADGFIRAGGWIELHIGDDLVDRANTFVVAGGYIDIYLDDLNNGSANGDKNRGADTTLLGAYTPGTGQQTRIFGNVDVDRITLEQTFLGGWTRVYGSNLPTPAGATAPTAADKADGEDILKVDRLQTMPVGTLTLDGQAGTDTYIVRTMARRPTVATTRSMCSIPAPATTAWTRCRSSDSTAINGEVSAGNLPVDDIFLLRASLAITGLGGDEMVPAGLRRLLHATEAQVLDGSYTDVERINYDAALNGRLEVFGQGGNDLFVTDDNSTVTTLDGGLGDDRFQIGQIYGSQRTTAAGIAARRRVRHRGDHARLAVQGQQRTAAGSGRRGQRPVHRLLQPGRAAPGRRRWQRRLRRARVCAGRHGRWHRGCDQDLCRGWRHPKTAVVP